MTDLYLDTYSDLIDINDVDLYAIDTRELHSIKVRIRDKEIECYEYWYILYYALLIKLSTKRYIKVYDLDKESDMVKVLRFTRKTKEGLDILNWLDRHLYDIINIEGNYVKIYKCDANSKYIKGALKVLEYKRGIISIRYKTRRPVCNF